MSLFFNQWKAQLNGSKPQFGKTKRRYVFAHHIVGNTYPYQLWDWEYDIVRALELGIDAFALNIGPDSWESARVADAYQAAQNVATITGKVFKVFISFDLSFAFTADQINTYIESYATHPNQFMYQNGVFVSTFSGEGTTFGESNINDGWQLQIKNVLAKKGISIYFVPEWSALDPNGIFQKYPVMDGILSWNAW